MTRRWGEEVKVASKERIGREPRRQLPGKWSSEVVCTVDNVSIVVMEDKRDSGRNPAMMGRGRTILQVEFHSWAIGRFAHPYIEVFAFPRLEKKHIVTIVKIRQFIKLVELCLCVKLRILATMG